MVRSLMLNHFLICFVGSLRFLASIMFVLLSSETGLTINVPS